MGLYSKLKSFITGKDAFADIIRIGMILTVLGVIGTVGIYINENVSDKAALVDGDTYYNASQDVVGSVETGWDFVEILVLVAIAAVIIGMLMAVIPGFRF